MIDTDGQNIDKLVSSASKGNKRAMEELLHHYESLVYRTAFSSLRNSYDASDVTQEVLFKIYKTISSFRGDCTFSTWVYRVTCNAVTDFVRKKSRQNHVSLSYIDADSGEENEQDIPDEDPAVSPQLVLERTELSACVRQAIQELSPQHRNILILRDMEGYSYTEIAEMLGIDIGTVKSRLNRARNSLKRLLETGNKMHLISSITQKNEKE